MSGDDHGVVGGAQSGLTERVTALEAQVAGLSEQVQTRRLSVLGADGHERLVAELVDGVTELRLDLPGRVAGRRTSLLLFAVPDRPDWCAGLGVQLWVDGNMVDELSWWADGGGEPAL